MSDFDNGPGGNDCYPNCTLKPLRNWFFEQAINFQNYNNNHNEHTMKHVISNIVFKQIWQELELETNKKAMSDISWTLSTRNPSSTHTRLGWAGLGWARLALLGCTGMAGLSKLSKQIEPNGASPRTLGRSVASIHQESTWNPPGAHARLGWTGWADCGRLGWLWLDRKSYLGTI